MKTHQSVSSQRRKSRKEYFTAPSSVRRVLLSSHLSADLRKKYSVRSIPVRKGDQVKVVRGHFKGNQGKVLSVYRRRWCIYIEKIENTKLNGQQVQAPIHPSNVEVTSLKLDKDRKALLERKKRSAATKDKQMSKMD